MENGYVNTTTFEQRYEDLMRWAMNNYSDMLREDKAKYDSGRLMMDIMNMDIGCVISNNDEYVAFIKDLKGRINIYLADERKVNTVQETLNNIKNSHLDKLNEWEMNFIESLITRKVKTLSDKQKTIVDRIKAKCK